MVGHRRPGAGRRRRHAGRRLAHAQQHLFVRDDDRARGDAERREGHADDLRILRQGRQQFVAADVLGIGAGVQDVAHRLGRRGRGEDRVQARAHPAERRALAVQAETAIRRRRGGDRGFKLQDGREDLRRGGGRAGVDQQDAVGTDRHGDVAAGAGQHVDVALHRHHLDVRRAGRALRRSGRCRRSLARRQHRGGDGGDAEHRHPDSSQLLHAYFFAAGVLVKPVIFLRYSG